MPCASAGCLTSAHTHASTKQPFAVAASCNANCTWLKLGDLNKPFKKTCSCDHLSGPLPPSCTEAWPTDKHAPLIPTCTCVCAACARSLACSMHATSDAACMGNACVQVEQARRQRQAEARKARCEHASTMPGGQRLHSHTVLALADMARFVCDSTRLPMQPCRSECTALSRGCCAAMLS